MCLIENQQHDSRISNKENQFSTFLRAKKPPICVDMLFFISKQYYLSYIWIGSFQFLFLQKSYSAIADAVFAAQFIYFHTKWKENRCDIKWKKFFSAASFRRESLRWFLFVICFCKNKTLGWFQICVFLFKLKKMRRKFNDELNPSMAWNIFLLMLSRHCSCLCQIRFYFFLNVFVRSVVWRFSN